MTGTTYDARLVDVEPRLHESLTSGSPVPTRFLPTEILQRTVGVKMRDGVRLATDLYLPPCLPSPVLTTRTPYGRARRASTCMAFAQCGYVVVSQDCRGTGDSEPDVWEYYVYEPEDSIDLIEWIVAQDWCDGFIGGFGGSYAASTQWCMAAHSRMGTIVPEVGGLGVTFETARLYMFLNAYARSVGKAPDNASVSLSDLEREMLPETLAGGYFNDAFTVSSAAKSKHCSYKKRRLIWRSICGQPPAQRTKLLKEAFDANRFTFIEMERLCSGPGAGVAYGAHSIPSSTPGDLCRRLTAPALLVTGWYDWNLNDTLASWDSLRSYAKDAVRERCRLLITPSAHNATGYHEGHETHVELNRTFRTPEIADFLTRWYGIVRANMLNDWPNVIYYQMGANEWRAASSWPPAQARVASLYLSSPASLTSSPPTTSWADRYIYDPANPTPTAGGSIVSNVYRPGSADVSSLHRRADVLTYTTPPLRRALDVVGPLRLTLYASSSATDTDFCARLSDVFPDGRAIQLQSGMLRARYRNPGRDAEPLVPGKLYRFDIDMWATANQFLPGHRLRIDISSSDFPRYDRNSNLGGGTGLPCAATQTIYHEPEHPSHLQLFTLCAAPLWTHFEDPQSV